MRHVRARLARTPRVQVPRTSRSRRAGCCIETTGGRDRDAVRDFVARYNAAWLIEKNGHRSPADMRAVWQKEIFRSAA
jgi:phosphoserine aminotransferase